MTTRSAHEGSTFSGTLAYDRARDVLSISFDGNAIEVPGASVRRAMQCELRIERTTPGAATSAATVRLTRPD